MRTLEELQSAYEFLYCLPNGIRVFNESLSVKESALVEFKLIPTFANVITIFNVSVEELRAVIADKLMPIFEKATQSFADIAIIEGVIDDKM